MRYVVDASVAVKWLLAEPYEAAALCLVSGGALLLAPELLWVEVVAALRKRLRRGDLSIPSYRSVLDDMTAWQVSARPLRPLLRPAADLSLLLDHSVYDCVYLALAEREQSRLVTADHRLHAKVEQSELAGVTMWIEDVP